jgi:hypothetical protein
VDTRRGQFPLTSFVLAALVKKQSDAGSTALSRTERVLLAACQFWAAVGTRSLAQYLNSESVPRLLLAFEAFSEIGAVRVASALRVVAGYCPEAASSTWLQRHVGDLEAQLLDTDDPVDRLIAQYASTHIGDCVTGQGPLQDSPRYVHQRKTRD